MLPSHWQTFLLRNLGDSLNSFAASDKVMILRSGTNDGTDLDVDLSRVLRPGANVSYVQLHQATVSAAGILITLPTAPTSSNAVTALIIADPNDVATA